MLKKNLCFKEKDIQRALDYNVKNKHADWGFTPKQNDSYIKVVSRRWMNMFQDVRKASNRTNKPKWYNDLRLEPEEHDGDTEIEADSQEIEEEECEEEEEEEE